MTSVNEEVKENNALNDDAYNDFCKEADEKSNYLILMNDNFCVYLDTDMDVEWMTSRRWECKEIQKHNYVLSKVAEYQSYTINALSSKNKMVKEDYRRLIAEALARSLDGDYVYSESMLEAAKTYRIKRNSEVSRYWYLQMALGIGVILCTLLLCSWSKRYIYYVSIGYITTISLISCLFGGLGSVFSIAQRLGKDTFESDSGRRLHYMECASRIFSGCLIGGLTSLLLRSGLILPSLNQMPNFDLYILSASFISGTSERYSKSIVEKYNIIALKEEE